MKKAFIIFTLAIALASCKKQDQDPQPIQTTQSVNQSDEITLDILDSKIESFGKTDIAWTFKPGPDYPGLEYEQEQARFKIEPVEFEKTKYGIKLKGMGYENCETCDSFYVSKIINDTIVISDNPRGRTYLVKSNEL